MSILKNYKYTPALNPSVSAIYSLVRAHNLNRGFAPNLQVIIKMKNEGAIEDFKHFIEQADRLR